MSNADRMELLTGFGLLVSIKDVYIWSQALADYGVKEIIAYALLMSAYLSIGLGAFNLMPLLPLDGGHMMNHYVPDVLQKPYLAVSAVLIYPLIVISLWNDAVLVAKLFWG